MFQSQIYVEVILPLAVKQTYTYSVPQTLKDTVCVGQRIAVQFGAKRIYTAIIKSITTEKPNFDSIKEILSIIDEKQIINSIQFKFWEWIASYYMCTEGEVYNAALPSGLKLESETKIVFTGLPETYNSLKNDERILIETLRQRQIMTIKECSEVLFGRNVINTINLLLNKDLLQIEEELKNTYKPRTESYIQLNSDLQNDDKLNETINQLKRAPKQLDLLMCFLNYCSSAADSLNYSVQMVKKDLLNISKTSHSVLSQLFVKEIFIETEKEISRLEFTDSKPIVLSALTVEQIAAKNQIEAFFCEKDVVLLHGITSSGKTEVYIHLISKYISQGKQVLYLLPEIALTSQIINRLTRYFGNIVGVYHSKFSDGERVEIWKNIAFCAGNSTEPYQIILGVRSSLLLPFDNLGLIIIDEEHENTYKQTDPAPRYHARDAAIVLAQLHGAKTLLGTATPSLESYYNTQIGKYGLVELNKRYSHISLPEVIMVDTKTALKRKEMHSHFSEFLLQKMKETLADGLQIILFQNRRGFSPYLQCAECGWIPKCKYCDVSLTYHKYLDQLTCHYCGFAVSTKTKCDKCGSLDIRTQSFGTEKIEDEIAILFPEAKIARMDLDTTRSKKAYQQIIGDFEDNRSNILIGTQMVSKGLDFDNVALVGIMSADNLLNYPDFRAYERSYQLMAQVSGRAGRKGKRGLVVIQTTSPDNLITKYVIENNYKAMFQSQIIERDQFKYPPFTRLILITLKNRNRNQLNLAAESLATEFRKIFGQRVLGPQFPLISKIQNFYLMNILLKIEKQQSVAKSKQLLIEIIENHQRQKLLLTSQVVINVDPQ